MTDVWTPLLASLQLSRAEREVVRRFTAEPNGRSFLPVADILRAHRLIDESLELLTQGVDRHPSFTVARVVLARELLAKGMADEAWGLLEQAPDSLRDNVLAQKLRLKLALIQGQEAIARATYQHLKQEQMLDPEIRRLGELLEISGLSESRNRLQQDLAGRGTQITLPPLSSQAAAATATASPSPSPLLPPPPLGSAPVKLDQRLPHSALPEMPALELPDEHLLSLFHVVPLAEIFRLEQSSEPLTKNGTAGVELDSTTLAEIYSRQGHYGKALEVYRRMLRLMPGSDLLRRKVAELAKLEREQRDVDQSVDPLLVDRMESVEIIDRQIKFYNDLLGRLG